MELEKKRKTLKNPLTPPEKPLWKPEFGSRIGHHVTESIGARVMHDGVVSSVSPADIAYVPRKAAQICSHSKTSSTTVVLFRAQNKQGHTPSGTHSHAQASSVCCDDCHLHSRCSIQPAERTPKPSPSCLSRYSSSVGEHFRQLDVLSEAKGMEKGCERLLTSPQSPGPIRIIPLA